MTENVNGASVPTAHRRERARKLVPALLFRIAPSFEILRTSVVPSSTVQCLHQWKIHMKRKLRGWRACKCKPCVGAKGVPTRTGLQICPFTAIQHSDVIGNLRIFVVTSSTVQCMHQCKVYMKRKLRGWRA